jgi:hypothetical protein
VTVDKTVLTTLLVFVVIFGAGVTVATFPGSVTVCVESLVIVDWARVIVCTLLCTIVEVTVMTLPALTTVVVACLVTVFVVYWTGPVAVDNEVVTPVTVWTEIVVPPFKVSVLVLIEVIVLVCGIWTKLVDVDSRVVVPAFAIDVDPTVTWTVIVVAEEEETICDTVCVVVLALRVVVLSSSDTRVVVPSMIFPGCVIVLYFAATAVVVKRTVEGLAVVVLETMRVLVIVW